MKRADKKFARGQRVTLSERGKDQLLRISLNPNWQIGTVVGFGCEPTLVRIKFDDIQTVDSFHMDFWEPVTG